MKVCKSRNDLAVNEVIFPALTRVDYYHMSDFWKSKRDACGWGVDRGDPSVSSILDVIYDNKGAIQQSLEIVKSHFHASQVATIVESLDYWYNAYNQLLSVADNDDQNYQQWKQAWLSCLSKNQTLSIHESLSLLTIDDLVTDMFAIDVHVDDQQGFMVQTIFLGQYYEATYPDHDFENEFNRKSCWVTPQVAAKLKKIKQQTIITL